MKKFLYALPGVAMFLGVVGAPLAQALCTAKWCAVVPPGDALYPEVLADLLNNVAKFLIFASVVIVVIFIIWAGITYTAAGADQTKVKAAKDRLKQGMIGGLIIFGVGTILATIIKLAQAPGTFF